MSERNSSKSTEPLDLKEVRDAQRARSGNSRRQHQSFPGLLALAWMMYLLSAAFLTMFWRQPLHADVVFFESAVRDMLVLIVVGLLLLWPMIRLSQIAAANAASRVLADVIILSAIAQVVIWPVRLVTRWSVATMWAIDISLLSWAIAVSGIIILGLSTRRRGARVTALAASALLIVAGPLCAILVSLVTADLPPERLLHASPLAIVFSATPLEAESPVLPAAEQGLVMIGVGMALWGIALVLRRQKQHGRSRGRSLE